ncbi:MAG: hypothetical protein JRJ51_10915 [Deltaproteobacteria bacterium]|nr:hypothetical protein [Deltaproteobacteria bacterium]
MKNISIINEIKLHRAKVKEKNWKKFTNETLEIEHQVNELNALLPPKLGVESFLDQFSFLANGFNIEVRNAHRVVKQRDFYVEALLSMTLYGNEKDVRALIEKQLGEKRLTSWKTLRGTEKTFPIEIIIYSIKQWKPKKIDIDKIMCPEFESKIWLWPFKGRIEKKHHELDDLCKKAQDHFKTLKLIEELIAKKRYLNLRVHIFKELEKNRTLPSFVN